jgi:hypothetical protein
MTAFFCRNASDRKAATWKTELGPFSRLEFAISDAAKGIAAAVEQVAEARHDDPSAPPLEHGITLAVPLLKDQFLIGLLHEDLEEAALEFETGLMNERLDLVGEVLVLGRHGQRHPHGEFEGDVLVDQIDGAAPDGSLKSVGGAHGVSPY